MKKTVPLIFLWIPLWASAQSMSLAGANDQKAAFSAEVGESFWSIKNSASADISPAIQPKTFLFLPDADTKWAYRNPHTELKVVGSQPITPFVHLNLKFKADQQFGTKLDELSLDWALSPSWGFRAGVVDYKTTWCQNYDADSPWIVSPTLACSNRMFAETSGGAPGVQSYINLEVGQRYNMQALVGVYNPLIMNYAPKEFAQWIPSEQYQVRKNNKLGGSLNLLNTWTGTEYRLSWVHTQQEAFSPEQNILGTTRQHTDLIYAGANFILTPTVQLQLTRTQQYLSNNCEAVYQAQCQPDHVQDMSSTDTVKLLYHLSPKDVLGASYSHHQIASQSGVSVGSITQWDNDFYRETHNGWGFAWRHAWAPQVFSAVQLQLQDQSLGYSPSAYAAMNLPTSYGTFSSSGWALGLKLAYIFN